MSDEPASIARSRAPRVMPRARAASERALPPALLPYLRLVRAPAVFSALGDPLAGLLIGGAALDAGRGAQLAAGSALMYLAGMALNDLADREEDARERPERPIPSGAISPRTAAIVGSTLLFAGIGAARGAGASWTAPALAALVVAYDFKLKHSATLGPIAMGACRSLSLLMGVEAAGGLDGVAHGSESAALLGAYVAGLTLLARSETGVARTAELRGGAAIAAAALLVAAVRGGPASALWAGAVAAVAGPAVSRALRKPGPATVGPAVGALIRAVPALDGALVGASAPAPALLLLSLLGLTHWGRKLIPIT